MTVSPRGRMDEAGTAPCGDNTDMETLTKSRPTWATVVDCRIEGEAWVELESGSIVPIDAPPETLELLEHGVSVLVDVDRSGAAVPWSEVVVTRPPGLRLAS